MNTTISPEAAQAVEQLRQSGFKITSDTGSYRLIRSDGSQAANGHLGNVSNDPEAFNRAAINGLKRAQHILKDEARRVSMTRPVFGKEGSWASDDRVNRVSTGKPQSLIQPFTHPIKNATAVCCAVLVKSQT